MSFFLDDMYLKKTQELEMESACRETQTNNLNLTTYISGFVGFHDLQSMPHKIHPGLFDPKTTSPALSCGKILHLGLKSSIESWLSSRPARWNLVCFLWWLCID